MTKNIDQLVEEQIERLKVASSDGWLKLFLEHIPGADQQFNEFVRTCLEAGEEQEYVDIPELVIGKLENREMTNNTEPRDAISALSKIDLRKPATYWAPRHVATILGKTIGLFDYHIMPKRALEEDLPSRIVAACFPENAREYTEINSANLILAHDEITPAWTLHQDATYQDATYQVMRTLTRLAETDQDNFLINVMHLRKATDFFTQSYRESELLVTNFLNDVYENLEGKKRWDKFARSIGAMRFQAEIGDSVISRLINKEKYSPSFDWNEEIFSELDKTSDPSTQIGLEAFWNQCQQRGYDNLPLMIKTKSTVEFGDDTHSKYRFAGALARVDLSQVPQRTPEEDVFRFISVLAKYSNREKTKFRDDSVAEELLTTIMKRDPNQAYIKLVESTEILEGVGQYTPEVTDEVGLTLTGILKKIPRDFKAVTEELKKAYSHAHKINEPLVAAEFVKAVYRDCTQLGEDGWTHIESIAYERARELGLADRMTIPPTVIGDTDIEKDNTQSGGKSKMNDQNQGGVPPKRPSASPSGTPQPATSTTPAPASQPPAPASQPPVAADGQTYLGQPLTGSTGNSGSAVPEPAEPTQPIPPTIIESEQPYSIDDAADNSGNGGQLPAGTPPSGKAPSPLYSGNMGRKLGWLATGTAAAILAIVTGLQINSAIDKSSEESAQTESEQMAKWTEDVKVYEAELQKLGREMIPYSTPTEQLTYAQLKEKATVREGERYMAQDKGIVGVPTKSAAIAYANTPGRVMIPLEELLGTTKQEKTEVAEAEKSTEKGLQLETMMDNQSFPYHMNWTCLTQPTTTTTEEPTETTSPAKEVAKQEAKPAEESYQKSKPAEEQYQQPKTASTSKPKKLKRRKQVEYAPMHNIGPRKLPGSTQANTSYQQGPNTGIGVQQQGASYNPKRI